MILMNMRRLKINLKLNKMKRILTILVAVAIFTACGTKSNEAENDTVDSLGTIETDTIVVSDSLIIITIQKDSLFKISK